MPPRDETPENKISSDGLRYTARTPGSPFDIPTSGRHATTVSCFKYGCHKPHFELVTKRILGRHQKIYATECQVRA